MRIFVLKCTFFSLLISFFLNSCHEDSSINPTNSRGIETFVPPEVSIIKWPFTSSEDWYITRGYGEITHNGADYFAIDYSLPIEEECFGQKFKAPFSGKVIYSTVTELPDNQLTGYGNQVIIQSSKDSSFALRAAHFQIIEAFKGQYIEEGDLIGRVGSTGNSRGCHVHIALYRNIYGAIYNYASAGSSKAIEVLETGSSLYNAVEGSPKEAFASPFKFVREDSVHFYKENY